MVEWRIVQKCAPFEDLQPLFFLVFHAILCLIGGVSLKFFVDRTISLNRTIINLLLRSPSFVGDFSHSLGFDLNFVL